jgi:uncharacterized protein
MASGLDKLDLDSLGLMPGAGRRLELAVGVDDLLFASERYAITPQPLPVTLDISRLSGPGFALRARFTAQVNGPCMRCLKPARLSLDIESREVDTPISVATAEADEDLLSPYVVDDVLDVGAWARDALIVNLPATLLCRQDCAGLCPVCAADLSEAGEGHSHDLDPYDPRWAKLRELRLD